MELANGVLNENINILPSKINVKAKKNDGIFNFGEYHS